MFVFLAVYVNDHQDGNFDHADSVPSLFTVLIDTIFSQDVIQVIENARSGLESYAVPRPVQCVFLLSHSNRIVIHIV